MVSWFIVKWRCPLHYFVRLTVFTIALMCPVVAIAQPMGDLSARVNSEIAMKLGSLELTSSILAAQLDVAKARIAELERLCGEPCKAKAPEAK
jgi:hypothetical protein